MQYEGLGLLYQHLILMVTMDTRVVTLCVYTCMQLLQLDSRPRHTQLKKVPEV